MNIIKKRKYKFGFSNPENPNAKKYKGLNSEVVNYISDTKNEPDWMREFRLNSLKIFNSLPMPNWGADLSKIDFKDIYYYIMPNKNNNTGTKANPATWDDVDENIKNTFEKLGIPEAERKYLAGVEAQYDSESIYTSIKSKWAEQGVIFLPTDIALKEYPEIFKKYFSTIIPPRDNKFAALNSAVWSGGSFIYVPKNVHVDIPLQAYFRINAKSMGQFERTLIIADEGSSVGYVEGCTAPIYDNYSLHSAVVEILVEKNARVRYTTIQNWSRNVYNLVTKRAIAMENARMEWIDGNLGSYKTMKYPSVYLMGNGASGEVLSIAFAGNGQHIDSGAKMIHMAPCTTSVITSKSISQGNGRSSYRGYVKVTPDAVNSKVNVKCDALLLSKVSRTDTYPLMNIEENQNIHVQHEASIAKIDKDQLLYLQSRGLSEDESLSLIVNGFIEPIVKELPLEYAIELNKLINLQLEGSVG